MTGVIQEQNKKTGKMEDKRASKSLSRSNYLQLVINHLNDCRRRPSSDALLVPNSDSGNIRQAAIASATSERSEQKSEQKDIRRVSHVSSSSNAMPASGNILPHQGTNNRQSSSSSSSSSNNIPAPPNLGTANSIIINSNVANRANAISNTNLQCSYQNEPLLQDLISGVAPWAAVHLYKYVPVNGYGLYNPQNRCFANSLMQVLARAPALVAAVNTAVAQLSTVQTNAERAADAALLRALHVQLSGNLNARSQAMDTLMKTFVTAMKLHSIAKKDRNPDQWDMYNGLHQNDASEFLLFLLDVAARAAPLTTSSTAKLVLGTAVQSATQLVKKKVLQCEDPDASDQRSCNFEVQPLTVNIGLFDKDIRTNTRFTNVQDSLKAHLYATERLGKMVDLCNKATINVMDANDERPFVNVQNTVERWPPTLIIFVVRIWPSLRRRNAKAERWGVLPLSR